jgi:hypothetical protein
VPRSPDPRAARVREALALRRWALPALCGAPGAAPEVSREGWSTFLRSERCALALLALGDAVLGEGAKTARRLATIETQRVLSAGAQLHALGTRARREGWPLVVLKGGVPLAEGRQGADLVDVDVLASPEHARALDAALATSGYEAHGRNASHRLPERTSPDAVQVEIHTGVPGLGGAAEFIARAVPARTPGLLAPHPADHLWHLLLHTVAQHTGRRGSLRELVVLADALGRCAPEDVASAEARAGGRSDGPALLAQLELARALREHRPPADDPFAGMAAGVYVITEHLAPREIPPKLKAAIAERTFTLLARRAGTAPAEALGTPLRRLVRRAPGWLVTPPALHLARLARAATR